MVAAFLRSQASRWALFTASMATQAPGCFIGIDHVLYPEAILGAPHIENKSKGSGQQGVFDFGVEQGIILVCGIDVQTRNKLANKIWRQNLQFARKPCLLAFFLCLFLEFSSLARNFFRSAV